MSNSTIYEGLGTLGQDVRGYASPEEAVLERAHVIQRHHGAAGETHDPRVRGGRVRLGVVLQLLKELLSESAAFNLDYSLEATHHHWNLMVVYCLNIFHGHS